MPDPTTADQWAILTSFRDVALLLLPYTRQMLKTINAF